MVTTRRSADSYSETYSERKANVALLEREYVPSSYEEFVGSEKKEEVNFDEEKLNRQRNLQKLLNYDRYSETYVEEPVSEVKEAVATATVAMSEDDIRPTSTTMQFGDGDVDQMYQELRQEREQARDSHKLNAKGKFILVLYALAVTVIMALIIVNTGVLSRLTSENQVKQAELESIVSEYNDVHNQYQTDITDSVVAERAESLGMIR